MALAPEVLAQKIIDQGVIARREIERQRGCDAGDLRAPVPHEIRVLDEDPRQRPRAPLRKQIALQPERLRELEGCLVAGREGGGHFLRMAKRDDGRGIEPHLTGGLEPEVREQGDPGLLDENEWYRRQRTE